MRIHDTSVSRVPLPPPTAPGSDAAVADGQPWVKEDAAMTTVRNGHLREPNEAGDRLNPQEQVELLKVSSSASFSTSTTMGDPRQLPSIVDSKADLCPDAITFTEAGPWQRRTKLEKCLIVLVLVFFIASVVFLILFVNGRDTAKDGGGSKGDDREICTSNDCLQTAAHISSSVDTNVAPCDDFYQFACGGWIAKNPIPPAFHSINNFNIIKKSLQESMRDILTENEPSDQPAIMKAKTFFRSCEDIDSIDAKGTKPMQELLATGRRHLFPTLEENWEDLNLTLSDIVARVGEVGHLGTSPIISLGVSTDQKQSMKNIIYLTQTDYFLPSRQLFLGPRNHTVLTLYEQLYAHVTTLLGANRTTAMADAKDLVDFEILVANATDPRELRRDAEALYHKMTVRNLTARYPQFEWLAYLNRQFNPAGINITLDEEVVVNALRYYDKIFSVVQATSRRTLLNYGMWRTVYPLVGLLHKPLRDAKKKFLQTLSGAVRSQDRWKECVSTTDVNFPDAVGRLFVDRKFTNGAKARVEEMIRDLLAAFKEMLRKVNWMSDRTKQEALEKADAMVFKIGYPDEILNNTRLNEKMVKDNITTDHYFQNQLTVFRHLRRKNLKKLREPVNRNEWPISAATVNAFYNRQTNEIVFPAGILHTPFFSQQYLDALNYGGIGFVIGHEITHGFDDTGSKFDKDGNLRTWWQKEDLQRFQDRYSCMVKQYSSYTDPKLGIKLNGKLTIGEDIADNGGLKEAYRAYRTLVEKKGKEEPRLPALNYTGDQLFFIGAAQAWCGTVRDKMRRILLQTDYHSPMRFRVVGPFQNNEDFSRAFSCPVGSYMNPAHRCSVW